jgi:hypothetical protein
MTRLVPAVLAAAALASASPCRAQSLESLRLSADSALTFALPQAVHPGLLKPAEPVLQKALVPRPIRPFEAPGAVVGRVSLPSILDQNRRLLTRVFGARSLEVGAATDAAFSTYFLTFADAASTALAPFGDLGRLRGSGVEVRIDAATVYNFKVAANLFSPVRGSTLKMTPVRGTRGPQHDVKTGVLLDALRARSFVFKARGQEYWMLYGADAKPDGSGFASTRSFLFIKEDGLSTKAWPLAETRLKSGSTAVVDLGGVKLSLTRTAAGELVIRE